MVFLPSFRFDERVKLQTELKAVQDRVQGQRFIAMREDLKGMRRLLKRMEYVDDHSVVTVKGRVACEISAADELIVAELLFQNLFNEMSVSLSMELMMEISGPILSCWLFCWRAGDTWKNVCAFDGI